MKLFATSAALSLLLSASAHPQNPGFPDPANLRGERVSPRTGRELPIDRGSRGLEQCLRRLRTRASLMLIVAHPDDEDGGMLTLYSRGLGARVANLTLNRGEGGQNAMTGDFGDALGLIRTQELLAADRYFGVDQFFGTEVDFGFSKTKEEAFSKWTHERVLYDAVRSVRLYRPLVIASVFVGGVTDGHGQHQVSGEIAQEVFKAAGDPEVFPELTREGILPWKPLKVYARVPMQAITAQGLYDYATGQYTPARFTNYVTGETSKQPPRVDVVVHEGGTDSLFSSPTVSGADGEDRTANPGGQLSYVQFARIGLGLQRTQIGPNARLAGTGAYDIGYHRYGSRLATQPEHETSFFDGIDTSLEGMLSLAPSAPGKLRAGLHSLSERLEAAGRNFDAAHPEALAPSLAAAQEELGRLLYDLDGARFPGHADVAHELRIKQVQLNEAITDALGLSLDSEAEYSSPDVPEGTVLRVKTRLQSASAEPVGIYSERLEAPVGPAVERLLAVDREPVVRNSAPFGEGLEATPALLAQPTKPPFSRLNSEQPFYTLADPALRNAAVAPPALTAWATLRYHGVEVSLGRVVHVAEQAVDVVPPVSVALRQHAQALPSVERTLVVQAEVKGSGGGGTLHLKGPAGWQTEPASMPLGGEGDFTVHVPEVPAVATLEAQATLAGRTYTEGYHAVGYPGLPRTNFYLPATERVVPVNLTLPHRRRIAYLPGTGDAVPEALASVGLPVQMLQVSDLTPAGLAKFDTVLLGVRTYNAHPDLHGGPTQALFDFARAGGNVVVQYQTPEFTAGDAPYPLSLGNAEKVVDETDAVHLLVPKAPLLETPNRVTVQDFSGWVEERGHDFLDNWDPHYTALIEVHDPGQAPQRGGLVTTALGRGHWTYTAFALYRQLPEAVPGAFRVFVNLLGLADEASPQ